MAIDNVLLLLLVPLAGAASDRLRSRGRGRRPIMLPGLVLAAAGMALLPESTRAGLAGLLGGMMLLFAGINVQRSPFQALIADLVPSRYRSLATGSVTFQMCVGAIVFLMLGQMLGMRPPTGLPPSPCWRSPSPWPAGFASQPRRGAPARETTFRSMADAARSALRGDVAGIAGHLCRLAAAAAHLSNVHDVVCPACHRALRRPPRGRDGGVHCLGGRRRHRRPSRRDHWRAHRPPQHDAPRVCA